MVQLHIINIFTVLQLQFYLYQILYSIIFWISFNGSSQF